MNKKAESGIGTLIIFIAMLLVAAIAAGVLIQTTNSLQNKALTVGVQSQNQISNHIDVMKITGMDGTDGIIDNITVMIRLAAGSDSIFLNETIISVDTPAQSISITRADVLVTYLSNSTASDYLKLGDLVQLTFIPGSLTRGQKIKVSLIPKIGIPTTIEFNMPDIISDYRISLYPSN